MLGFWDFLLDLWLKVPHQGSRHPTFDAAQARPLSNCFGGPRDRARTLPSAVSSFRTPRRRACPRSYLHHAGRRAQFAQRDCYGIYGHTWEGFRFLILVGAFSASFCFRVLIQKWIIFRLNSWRFGACDMVWLYLSSFHFGNRRFPP